MPDKTINDEMTKPEKEGEEVILKDKNKTQKELKSKRKRNSALIQLTIIISFAFGFFGNFLATSTFRLIENTPFNNIYLFIVSGIGLVFFAWMLPYLIKIGYHDIDEMMKN